MPSVRDKILNVTSLLVVEAANGVVIATEKKLPSILVDETSVSGANASAFAIHLCCVFVWNKWGSIESL